MTELELTFADRRQATFRPLELHFHAPSEHTVDGSLYDLELHIVHTTVDESGNEAAGAVLGVFFDVKEGGNEENAFIDSLFEAIKTRDTSRKDVGITDFLAFIDMKEFWSYDGSLTTPPCTEGLKWSIIEEVQSISKEQLHEFTKHLAENTGFADGNGNSRRVQPLNDRILYTAKR